MKQNATAAILIVFSTISYAEIQSVSVPKIGTIAFNAPPMQKIKENVSGGDFRYVATGGRYNLSVYVTGPICGPASSHKDIAACFVEKHVKAGFNLEPPTVTCDERRCMAVSVRRTTHDGIEYGQVSINALFLFEGKWGDVHFSIQNPTDSDAAILESFDSSFSYGK
jgi:hypothetical protein